MELEEMQAAWSQMSAELDQQKQLTDDIIMKMAQQKFKSKIDGILRVERIGALICFVTIVYIVVNFSKFVSWQSQLSAIIVIVTIGGMSIVSLLLLKKMKALNLQKDSLKTTIIKYASYKKFASKFQMMSIIVGFFVLFASSAVFSVLFSGKDMFLEIKSWEKMIPAFILGIIVFGIIAYLGGRFYGKSLQQAQEVLEDLNT